MIILSAALDLVGPTLPKAIVLLADVLPSFLTKLVAPYFVHLIPYRIRILIFVGLSFVGMQLVAWASSLPDRLFGIMLASISAGLGELSFLGMTHFYGPFAVPFWSSGTGGAGLIGAGLYVFATSWVGWSVRGSLMVFGFLPVVMLGAFFLLLPLAPLRVGAGHGAAGYERVSTADEMVDGEVDGGYNTEEVGLLAQPGHLASPAVSYASAGEKPLSHKIWAAWAGFRANLKRTKRLFFP